MSEHHDSAAQLSREHWLQSDELRNLLEQAFLLEENGSAIDWISLADGNAALASVAQDVAQLGSMPEAVTRAENEDESAADSANYLGGYRILRLIGEGGMARVFLALDESLNREVAIKVLDPSFAQDAQRRARFRREAEITATLDHPAIVPIYGIGEDMGHPFIAMKLLEGQSLAALGKHLSFTEIATIGATLADALHHAHLAGVIHRDVKPSNVILTAEGPVLVDFGLAWTMAGQDLTEASSVPGTLAYMSPEQIEGNQGLDPRSDVFALGATLYELLGGKPAFMATTTAEVIRLILTENPESLNLKGRARDLETILLRALEKDRARRFASANDLSIDLRRLLGGLPILSRRHSLLERLSKLATRHHKTTLFALFVLVVIMVLFAVLMFTVWREGQRVARIESQAQATLVAGDFETVLALTQGEPSPQLHILELKARQRLAYEDLREQLFDFSNFRDPQELLRLMNWAEELVLESVHDAAFKDLALALAFRSLQRSEESERSLARFRAALPSSQAGLALRKILTATPDALASSLLAAEPQEFQSLDDQVYYALILCQARVDLGRCEAAVNRVLKQAPEHRLARQLAGRIAFLQGNFELAIAHFSGLDRHGQLQVVFARNIIRSYLALGDEVTAYRLFEQLEVEDTSLSSTHLRLDIAARELGDTDFQELLDWTIKRWPSNGYALVLAASRAFNATDYEAAANYARRATETDLSPYAEINLANVQLTMALMKINLAGATRSLETNDPRRQEVENLFVQLLDLREKIPTGYEVWRNIEELELRLRLLLGEHDYVVQVLEEGLDENPHQLGALNLYLGILGSDYAQAATQGARLDAEGLARLRPHFKKALQYQIAFAEVKARPRTVIEQTLVMHFLRIAFFAEAWAEFDAMVEIFQKDCPDLAVGQNLRIVDSLTAAAAKRR